MLASRFAKNWDQIQLSFANQEKEEDRRTKQYFIVVAKDDSKNEMV